MARLLWDRRALEDLERLADFLAKDDAAAAEATFDLIEEAVDVLASHPLIGRRVSGGLRELVISRGRTGYVALYQTTPRSNASSSTRSGINGRPGSRIEWRADRAEIRKPPWHGPAFSLAARRP